MSNKRKGKIGKKLMFISLLLWIADSTTKLISTAIGEMICGEDYLCPVNGVVCDKSCGFNTDMHLAFSLVVIFILGMLLYLSSKKAHL